MAVNLLEKNIKSNNIDIKENAIFSIDSSLLALLLKDQATKKNILWATDDYASFGKGYSSESEITIFSITGSKGELIKPRTEKNKEEQQKRSRNKAEVFTPAWVCNAQNNLVDENWFGYENVFNIEIEKDWKSCKNKVDFSKTDKTWQDYVKSARLEITYGEAPYLTSRYDAVSGEYIVPQNRIGILDRKLRIITENVQSGAEWLEWAVIAVQNVYGYDWQGDNVLLARENILYSVIEYYEGIYNRTLGVSISRKLAEIISWNIWQMDGLKCVVPNTCKNVVSAQPDLFNLLNKADSCLGCKNNDIFKHNGIYCKIMDWDTNKPIEFISLLKM